MSPGDEYEQIMALIIAGDIDKLAEIARTVEGFPKGTDRFLGRHWITNAIDCGTASAVKWMIERDAPVNYREDEGETALLAVIDRKGPDKYEIMQMLIDAGADINAKGYMDFAPAHRAASRNDVQALRILHNAGADFSIRTNIDIYATPLEEAEFMDRSPEAAAYLKSLNIPTDRSGERQG